MSRRFFLLLLLFLFVAVLCVVGVSIYVICPRFTPPPAPTAHLPRLGQKELEKCLG